MSYPDVDYEALGKVHKAPDMPVRVDGIKVTLMIRGTNYGMVVPHGTDPELIGTLVADTVRLRDVDPWKAVRDKDTWEDVPE